MEKIILAFLIFHSFQSCLCQVNCNLTWAPFKIPQPALINVAPVLSIVRTKSLGKYQLNLLEETDLSTRNKSFDSLQNPENCLLSWEQVSTKSLKFSVGVSSTTQSKLNIVGRIFNNGNFSVCCITKETDQSSLKCNGVKIQIQDPTDLQILTSFKPQPLFDIKFNRQPEIKSVRYPGTDFVRNKADVSVRQITTQTYTRQRTVRKSSDGYFDLDEEMLNTKYFLSLEMHKIKSSNEMHSKTLETRRTLTIPPRSSIKSCTILDITNSPIEVQYYHGNGKFRNVMLGSDQISSKYVVTPVHASILRSCIAFATENSTTIDLTNNSE